MATSQSDSEDDNDVDRPLIIMANPRTSENDRDQFEETKDYQDAGADAGAGDESKESAEKKKRSCEIPIMQINGLRIPEHRMLS